MNRLIVTTLTFGLIAVSAHAQTSCGFGSGCGPQLGGSNIVTLGNPINISDAHAIPGTFTITVDPCEPIEFGSFGAKIRGKNVRELSKQEIVYALEQVGFLREHAISATCKGP